MSSIKLIDVAREAGVSKSTVSQFLNGRFDYMSEQTRARIQSAVTRLDYVPNPIARSLKTRQTKTIGVVVRDVAGFYTSRAIRGMDDYCRANGYSMIIYNTDFDADTEAVALKTFAQLKVDGLLMAASGANSELIEGSGARGTPVVQFQLEHDPLETSIIVSDYRQAAFEATQYLIGLGHRRICFITQQFERVKSRRERYQGYRDALDKHSIPTDPGLVLYWQRDAGFQAPPVELLHSDLPPTAFFAQHLAITVDLLKALNQADVSIPDQVSVVGFDEVPMTEFFRVPITAVEQDPYQVGTEAAKLLIEHIRNPETQPRRILVPCTLVKRSSCKQLRPGREVAS